MTIVWNDTFKTWKCRTRKTVSKITSVAKKAGFIKLKTSLGKILKIASSKILRWCVMLTCLVVSQEYRAALREFWGLRQSSLSIRTEAAAAKRGTVGAGGGARARNFTASASRLSAICIDLKDTNMQKQLLSKILSRLEILNHYIHWQTILNHLFDFGTYILEQLHANTR